MCWINSSDVIPGLSMKSEATVDHFAQIVRRHVRCHANGNAARAVDQQVGESRGQYGGFLQRTVIVISKVDCILVEIVEQAVCDASEACLGITHRGRRIRVHRTEVTLTIDERHAQRPILRHTRQGVVDRTIAMRVVVTHYVADDLSALAIGTTRDKPALLARKKDSAVDGFQPVTNVRKSAADDHAHRVIEVARLHFVDNVDALVLCHRRGRGKGIVVVVQNGPDLGSILVKIGVPSM